MTGPSFTIYTIGHSNQAMDEFLRLLDAYQIEVLADVRSAPYSRWVPHFGKKSLEQAVAASGREYLYMGRELGGRPDPRAHPDLYDEEHHVRYDRLAELATFQSGIRTLLDRMASSRVAIMCSEEDPTHCHRRLLIGRVLTQSGDVELHHIRRDGGVEVETRVRLPGEDEPVQIALFREDAPVQISLFGDERDRGRHPRWRSTRSASAGSQQENFSRS